MTQSKTHVPARRVAPAKKRPTDWLRAIWAWVTLPGLLIADREAITELTVSRTSPERLSCHIDGVTWITGLAIVADLALVGQGRWNWETAIAVGALFAANGLNRLQHGLRGAKAALGLALLVDLIGLAGAFGVPMPAAEFAYVVLLLHVLWHLVQPAYAEE